MGGTRRPLIGIPADTRDVGDVPFHMVGHKYIGAVAEAAECLPVLIPALGAMLDIPQLLARLDGVVLPGSPSNVEPHRYGGPQSRPGTEHDPARDATTLALIRESIAAGLPTLAICRGMQELNVAYGGTLHQHLEEVPGRFDHRSDRSKSYADRYAPAHEVEIFAGSQLHDLARTRSAAVNSLHGQGIDRLGEGLAIEAAAPDGTIEAVRVAAARSFALGVQWHPEWRPHEHPFYLVLFRAFGAAARAHAGAE
ncbi:MAG: gamma-glutamyl-gamma-aminobutyrate hydrolase family protein [Alphaproteobacteria bacterium]|nr:gamma-glutamyl-gamma-aminobutyrate hydrolase family protein [Alphaproteobacteria bacterium]